MFRSVSTINSDVALKLYGAAGDGIVVAVLSSGIDASHPHFARHRNLELPLGLDHRDFTDTGAALADPHGHGTSVAAIVAGEYVRDDPFFGAARVRSNLGDISSHRTELRAIAGMAPRAKVLSVKVLDEAGAGTASSCIAALQYIDELNDRGSRLRVHVVLAPIAFGYEVEWFACGKSPICIETDRLVRAGVLVVTVSGNTGFGYVQAMPGSTASALVSTINDPGNADLAITVGSTHRDLPTEYGVSSFSSRGPTHDGRAKPDLVAPGERIMSALAGGRHGVNAGDDDSEMRDILYAEDSGTSPAAAHVAGVAAQVLSVRPALLGKPLELKRLLMETAIDLARVREFQGAGLVDVLSALSPRAGNAASQAEQRKSAELTAARVREEDSHPLKLMYCYSHKDEALLAELTAHLYPLQRQRRIDIWWDRKIEPGKQWDDVIADELSATDIIVPLVSSDFIKSDYCWGVELREAIARHNAGDARVVPVIVRAVEFESTPLGQLQALPKDALAVMSWPNADEAWADVARGIRAVVESLDAARGHSPRPVA